MVILVFNLKLLMWWMWMMFEFLNRVRRVLIECRLMIENLFGWVKSVMCSIVILVGLRVCLIFEIKSFGNKVWLKIFENLKLNVLFVKGCLWKFLWSISGGVGMRLILMIFVILIFLKVMIFCFICVLMYIIFWLGFIRFWFICYWKMEENILILWC